MTYEDISRRDFDVDVTLQERGLIDSVREVVAKREITDLATELVGDVADATGESGFDSRTVLMDILRRDPRGWQASAVEVINVLAKRYGLDMQVVAREEYAHKTIEEIAGYIHKHKQPAGTC